MFAFNFNYSILDYIFIVFCLGLFIQFVYFLLIFGRFSFKRKEPTEAPMEPVSIVICARNEADNLKENLPLILEQQYPIFEVVVVNDQSEDNTMEVLFELKHKYSNLKIVDFPENVNFFHGKKFPLSLGIRSASYDLILLTDADCKPTGKNWIASMQRNFHNNADIILGYGKYEKTKGFLNKLIRFDTFFIALQYFSFAKIGLPYMGVGRNLAYRRSFFFKNKGFVSHYLIPSGDDDLFVNQNANKNNTRVEIDADSYTVSAPKTTFKNWFYQKKRHVSTSSYYKPLHKILLGLYPFSFLLMLIAFTILIFAEYNLFWLISLFLLRILVQIIVLFKSSNKLHEEDLVWWAPLFEIIVLFINTKVFLSNYFLIKNNKWK